MSDGYAFGTIALLALQLDAKSKRVIELEAENARLRLARCYCAARAMRPMNGQTECVIYNPAPDAAAPAVPSGTFADVMITR